MEIDIRKTVDVIDCIRFADHSGVTRDEHIVCGDKYMSSIVITDDCCNEIHIQKGDLDNLVLALQKAKELWCDKRSDVSRG